MILPYLTMKHWKTTGTLFDPTTSTTSLDHATKALVQGLLEDSSLMKHHAPQLCRAVLQVGLDFDGISL